MGYKAAQSPLLSIGLCDSFQECEKPRRLIAPVAGRSLGLGESVQALGLHLEVGLNVVMGGFRTGMAQVQ